MSEEDETFDQLVLEVADACQRGAGTFGLCRAPKTERAEFVLVAGHHKAIEITGGYLVSLGLSREQVRNLRNACNKMLGD